jgi:hypothetical protein
MTVTNVFCPIFASVALILILPASAAAQGTNDERVEMSVEVSITHTMLDRDGNPALPPAVPTVFTVARTLGPAGWQTVMTYRKHTGPPTRSSSHPLDGARVEFDEGARAARVFDATGELQPLLSRESGDAVPVSRGPGQWLAGLVATDEGRWMRSRDLSEKYGNPVGREQGLDRFLIQRDGVVEEVLADPRSALPREINRIRDGILESHIVLEYDKRADGAWIRRRMRAEHFVPGDMAHRTRTVVEFNKLSAGGR